MALAERNHLNSSYTFNWTDFYYTIHQTIQPDLFREKPRKGKNIYYKILHFQMKCQLLCHVIYQTIQPTLCRENRRKVKLYKSIYFSKKKKQLFSFVKCNIRTRWHLWFQDWLRFFVIICSKPLSSGRIFNITNVMPHGSSSFS